MMQASVRRAQAGELALLVAADQKQFIFRLDPQAELQTHRGVIRHLELIGLRWGSQVESHLRERFLMFEPSLSDLLLHIRRRSQIIFPKDIGYILLRLSVGPGKTIVEAGTGSGALTTALAWMVGADGRVISYDRRQDMQELAGRNLQRVGLHERVDLRMKDIGDGFDIAGTEAIFLDLPTPHLYTAQAFEALSGGGMLGCVVPTTNQVADLLGALHATGFALPEVCEILMRYYKTVPQRLRPEDRMVAHTGYLVFARKVIPSLLADGIPGASAIQDDSDVEHRA